MMSHFREAYSMVEYLIKPVGFIRRLFKTIGATTVH